MRSKLLVGYHMGSTEIYQLLSQLVNIRSAQVGQS